jgi:hypothetical protein
MAVAVYEIALEGVDFTMVDVHEGFDEAFNTWYENDHFYSGGVMGPGVLSGRRWYCGRSMREARFVGGKSLFPNPRAGTNLATYFFNPGGGQAFKEWVAPQLDELWKRNRMFPQRDIVNICLYHFKGALQHAGMSHVAPHVALDHPFPGLVATLCSGPGEGRPAAPPPEGSLTLRFLRETQYLPLKQPDLAPFDPVTLLLTFLPVAPKPERPAIEAVARSAASLAGAEPLWASGFLPVVPGNPRHLAEMR